MIAKELPFGAAVRVWWDDSMTIEGWKYATQDLGGAGKIVSMGYVVNCTEEVLVMTTSIGANAAALSPLCIPWGGITKLDRLPKEWDRT